MFFLFNWIKQKREQNNKITKIKKQKFENRNFAIDNVICVIISIRLTLNNNVSVIQYKKWFYKNKLDNKNIFIEDSSNINNDYNFTLSTITSYLKLFYFQFYYLVILLFCVLVPFFFCLLQLISKNIILVFLVFYIYFLMVTPIFFF